MSRFLADENVPGDAVHAVRSHGYDIAWVHELSPSASDDVVLQSAEREDRTLVTFDKDFGELAFRLRRGAAAGVILLRPRLRSPDYLTRFLLAVLAQQSDWRLHFSVAREGRLRMIPFDPSAGR
jgi:predicted nuclease of predicted toxin-antitoxin system